jgi:serine protease Do
VAGRPDFGFTVETLDARILLYYNLPGRLCVRTVDESSDAYAQGIRTGDVITAINGESVTSTEELNRAKNNYAAGDSVTLSVYRNGKLYDVTIQLMDQADLQS